MGWIHTGMTLQDKAYRHIQQRILTGKLRPGAKLSELSLAHEIGISRAPVRDAITQLQVEGYLQRVPRSGTIVRKLDRHEIIELFELREALESHAAALAAQRAASSHIRKLDYFCEGFKHIVEKLHQSKDEQLDTETTRHHLAIEMGFHMHIIQAACNRVIMKHVITSHIMSRLLGELTLRHNTEVVNGAYQEHCQILEAIKTQNAEEARAFMARHIQNSRTQRIAQWDQTEAHQAFNQSASHSIPNDILVELNSMETGFFDME
jgi:DNA-binding GntR family transcriptional regulator